MRTLTVVWPPITSVDTNSALPPSKVSDILTTGALSKFMLSDEDWVEKRVRATWFSDLEAGIEAARKVVETGCGGRALTVRADRDARNMRR